MILEHIWVAAQARAKAAQARFPRPKAHKGRRGCGRPPTKRTLRPFRTAASSRWSSLWPPPRPCTARPSARLVRGRTQCSHLKDQAASCTCHHPAALWAWRSAGSLCSWLWCGDADTCCCMSVAQIGGFHCQSFVDVGLSLSFKVLWNLRFVLRGTHSLPTPHAYPVSRSAASAIRGSVETPETNGAIVLDRTANILQHGDRTEHPLRSVPSYTTRKGMVVLAVASRAENHKPAVSPPRPSHAMTGFPSSGDNKRLSTLLWRLK